MKKCPDCDFPTKTKTIPHKFKYLHGNQSRELIMNLPIQVCNNCNLKFIDKDGMDAQDEAVRKHRGYYSMWHFKIEYVIVGYCIYEGYVRYRMLPESSWLRKT